MNMRNNFQTSNKRNLQTIKNLLLDDNDLMEELFINRKTEFSDIGVIADCYDLNEMYDINYDNAMQAVDNIFNITDLSDPKELITLYRGVELGPDNIEPDLKNPGICWTFDKQTAINFVEQFDTDDPNFAPCILTAEIPVEDVDWLYSVACQCDEPSEKEIRLFPQHHFHSISYEVL